MRRAGGMARGGDPDRRFFDKCMRSGEAFRNLVVDGQKYLNAALNYDDKMGLLVTLTDPQQHGEKMLKTAVSSNDTPHFMNEFVVRFLALLGSDELLGGMLADSVSEVIAMLYHVPGLFRTLKKNLEAGVIQDKASVAWFVIKCCKDIQAARKEGSQCHDLALYLVEQEESAARPLKNLLNLGNSDDTCTLSTQMKLDQSFGVEDLLQQAGGRHDNDHIDFRDIALEPTIAEMMCEKEPFLPEFQATEAAVLDRQFRLLREDVIGPARQEFKLLRAGSGDQRNVYSQVRFHTISTPEKRGKACIRVSFALPWGHKTLKMKKQKEREDHWKQTGFGMLPIDALVSFVHPNGTIKYFATVVEREATLLATWREGDQAPRPEVGLAFQGGVERMADVIFECGREEQWQMIQISSSFFSYKPILKQLQAMDSIPLGHCLLDKIDTQRTPAYLADVDCSSYVAQKYPTLNPSQKEAVYLGLNSEVSLTQGPPGTGKTFMGVALTDVIYRNTDKTLLCICFTNHALDQFLEALLDKGMTDMVRIGSRSKSTRLEPYMIREKARNDPRSGALSQVFKRRVAQLYGRRQILAEELTQAVRELERKSKLFRGNKWFEVREWLEANEPDAFLQLAARVDDDDGFAIVGDDGKKLKDDWKWLLWIKGGRQPVARKGKTARGKRKPVPVTPNSIWSLTKEERRATMDGWSKEMGEFLRESIAELMVEMAEVDEKLNAAHQEPLYNVLKGCRVIGCTTTGAAKFADLIAFAKPSVIIAEEAAEILEAHILTSSSKHMEHLIMIGDHKQLRPKIDNHELSVVSGNQHDLNRSMFERLVLCGCKHATLLVQHRMRPEISKLIHSTYPALEDHASVMDREKVRGVHSNVVFLDHRVLEAQLDNWKQQHDSKTNMHEAEMVANVARYFLRQDYLSEQMVILTPYLGQLFLIQKVLKEALKLGIMVDDRDLADLKKMSGNNSDIGFIETSTEKGSVRVATIDNYQGEEADIVIASLVRSNEGGQIGFLKEPERLNVLLSRAKFGLILVGNAQCMRSARNKAGRELWTSLIDAMDANGQVFAGLPAQCGSHGRCSLLSTAAHFEEHAPSGGCTLQCGKQLPCGHYCPFKCHRFDQAHAQIRCTAVSYKYCDKGHMVKAVCGESKVKGCDVCDRLTQIEKQREKDVAVLEEEQAMKMQKYALERAQAENAAKVLQKKLDDQEAQYQESMAAERRKVALERKQRELELRTTYGADELEDRIAQEKEEMQRELDDKERALQRKTVQAKQSFETLMKKQQERLNQQNREMQNLDEQIKAADSNAKANAQRATQPSNNVRSSAERRLQLVSQLKDAMASKDGDVRLVLAKCKAIALQEVLELDFRHASQLVKDAQRAPKPPACTSQVNQAAQLLEKQEWLKAYDILDVLCDANPDAAAMMAYCEARLGNHQEAKERLGTVAGGQVEQRAAARLTWAVLEQANNNVRPTIATFAWALSALSHPSSNGSWAFIANAAMAILKTSEAALSEDESFEKHVVPKLFEEQKAAVALQNKWTKSAGTSDALASLLKLTGMQSVKQAFFNLNDRIKLDIERGTVETTQNFSVRFDGNPGTGKTTVARYYGQFLKEKGILADDAFIETSGSALVNGGTAELKKMLEKLEKGGVLFIDEAYQLNPTTNSLGAQVLDFLLPEMENRRGKLVVIIAGYAKPMADLIAHNEGLPSRFPVHFTFDDYSDKELFEILKGVIASSDGNFKLEDEKHARIAARRLGKQRGATGFGNARAVHNLWDQAKTNQSARILKERDLGKDPDMLLIERADLLGKWSIDAASCPALAELQDMRGLVKVKQSIQDLLSLVKTNAELEEAEKPLRKVALNRVFIGNPGTGKTTVAGIYARVLRDLGMLSKGEVVVKTPQDFLGSVLGESEKNTKAILDDTRGKVLVIDEAYGLQAPNNTTDPYRTAVIDTIVAEVQGEPGDDRCVLLLGYKDEISEMIRNANPGLARRFQMDDAFVFEDYNDQDLLYILQRKAKSENILMDLKTAREAVKILAQQRQQPNFGNAGAINNLVSRALQKMEKRLAHLPAQERAEAPVAAEDFISAEQEAALAIDPATLFDDLIGCGSVKDKLASLSASIELSRLCGIDPLENIQLNFFFAGSPGTGKTTVARKMGQMFSSLGLLSKSDVVECSANDFVTGFANQASGKTREMFRSALGGVLFIDEAYRLNPKKGGMMMAEVLDEIVTILTEEQFRNKMVVIFAGYEAELDDLMQANPGLKSRISEKIYFEDFKPDECAKLLMQELRGAQLVLDLDATEALPAVFESLIAAPLWSNGRDVKTLKTRIFDEKAMTIAKEKKSKPKPKPAGQSNGKDERGQGAVDGASEQQVSKKMVEDAAAKFLKDKQLKSSAGVDLQDQVPGQRNGIPQATAAAGPMETPTTATKTKSATSSRLRQRLESSEQPVAVSHVGDAEGEEVSNHFAEIPRDFLTSINNELLAAGVDISDANAILGVDRDALLARLIARGGRDAALVQHLIELWDKALREAVEQQRKIEEEIAEKKRKQRPRWRCAVCGRMGCQVAPYIEGYDEVDE